MIIWVWVAGRTSSLRLQQTMHLGIIRHSSVHCLGNTEETELLRKSLGVENKLLKQTLEDHVTVRGSNLRWGLLGSVCHAPASVHIWWQQLYEYQPKVAHALSTRVNCKLQICDVCNYFPKGCMYVVSALTRDQRQLRPSTDCLEHRWQAFS